MMLLGLIMDTYEANNFRDSILKKNALKFSVLRVKQGYFHLIKNNNLALFMNNDYKIFITQVFFSFW